MFTKINKGFTVVELIVAIGVGIIVTGIVTIMSIEGLANLRTITRWNGLQSDTMRVTDTFSYWVRNAKAVTVNSGDSLTVRVLDDSEKTLQKTGGSFTMDGSALNSGNSQLTALTFTKLERSVRISFTLTSLTGPETLSATTTSAMRNAP